MTDAESLAELILRCDTSKGRSRAAQYDIRAGVFLQAHRSICDAQLAYDRAVEFDRAWIARRGVHSQTVTEMHLLDSARFEFEHAAKEYFRQRAKAYR